MTKAEIHPDIDALESLLEAERTALLKGDLVSLTRMLPDKEALIDALNERAIDDLPALVELGSQVRRNQLLLDGALEGIREVANRMAALRKLRSGIETYGSDGARKHIDVAIDHTLERRA